jgi:F0F1-type ATP synthase assembly protein I
MPNPDPGKEPGQPAGEDRTPLEKQAPANQWMALLNLGWVFVASMGISVFGGIWLDRHVGTLPVFLLIGVFLGFAASGYSFYSALKKLDSAAPPQRRVKP